MAWVEPLTLQGSHCRLEPLSMDHHDALVDAVRDGELWNIWYAFVPKPEDMQKEMHRRLDLQTKGTMLPFTVFSQETGKPVGMTTYCHVDAENKRIEIGWTWYAKNHQRTGLNTECKLLLLTHAFEMLSCIAVELRVDYSNRQSRRAVERLGAG